MQAVRLLLGTVLFFIIFESHTIDGFSVSTPLGTIIGSRVNYGNDKRNLTYGCGYTFLGIPYTVPPVGVRRFTRSPPLTRLPTNPYNGSFIAPICPQNNRKNRTMSEDCLYLNIYTPNPYSNLKYPVMLYIHGGSLTSGSMYDVPTAAAIRNYVARGVVLVTIQYRVGLLGFFTTFTEDFPPNLGMLDQVEAIRFVKKYISYFGGDPNKLTLFGESAGSASVAAHLFSPLSQDLVNQAIMESGSILTSFDGAVGFQNNSYVRANTLCNYTTTEWYSGNFGPLKRCLMSMPYDQWVPMDQVSMLGWQMVRDNYFMPDVPQNLYKSRPNIPVIYGNCRDEYAAFQLGMVAMGLTQGDNFTEDDFRDSFWPLAFFYGDQEDAVLNVLLDNYANNVNTSDPLAWLKIQSDVFTGSVFTGFITREIDWYMFTNNQRVFVYEMTYPSAIGMFGYGMIPGWKPVYHTCELPFVFLHNTNASRADIEMADFFADAWTTFAYYGKPSRDNSWPATTRINREYIDINVQRQVKKFYRQVDNRVWNQLIPAMTGGFRPPQHAETGVDSVAKKRSLRSIPPLVL